MLIVLILFLGSPRSALIVGITIPFAMVVAFILMYHTGISANLLSLGAIDFDIIVDGAIVMTEAILRRREAKPNEPLSESDTLDAARQVTKCQTKSAAIDEQRIAETGADGEYGPVFYVGHERRFAQALHHSVVVHHDCGLVVADTRDGFE